MYRSVASAHPACVWKHSLPGPEIWHCNDTRWYRNCVADTPTRMWLLFVDSRRAAPTSAALTDAEAIAAMKTSVAWTGQYTIGRQSPDGLKATARVDTASSPALPGTDRAYFMNVEGNKLTMRSPTVIEPMTGVTSALVIELVKAD